MSLKRELANERDIIGRQANLETRARFLRTALEDVEDMQEWLLRERIRVITLLHEEFGWTDQQVADYFGFSSRQRVHQIRKGK